MLLRKLFSAVSVTFSFLYASKYSVFSCFFRVNLREIKGHSLTTKNFQKLYNRNLRQAHTYRKKVFSTASAKIFLLLGLKVHFTETKKRSKFESKTFLKYSFKEKF